MDTILQDVFLLLQCSKNDEKLFYISTKSTNALGLTLMINDTTNTLFHLAFPIHDFDLAKRFYLEQLGCKLGRESEHALIFQFGNHQIVAHKIDTLLPMQQGIYPRHFGLIFLEKAEFDAFVHHLTKQQMQFEVPLKTRFPQSKIEHQSFLLKIPVIIYSNLNITLMRLRFLANKN